ncbi:hypothetical protein PENTCL1PPCAC_30228 [Pristionchus entomophagus]|uniref:Uncharacterized protein n=1 Tax=Pristionchus entomophagus TaxID=358040 RepID=A0AAV5UP06_9BILA|nr:hypothetical protein PENTCL1PPCAC_30228 [Pristionchus entomophagus]
MNYDTAYTRSFASTSSTGGLKYGQHRSMFDSSDGFSANSYSRPSQPPDFFQYMRTGNPNMAPPLDYRNSAPLNLTPSAFPAQSQVTPFLPSREVNPREVNPDPGDPSFHQQFEGANCHRNPMDYQRRPRPDYVRSGEYGGRADRSGPPQMREGRYGGRGDRPVMGYGSREERREEHSRERSSSRRAEKRPREDGGDESEQMREIDRERGDDRNLRRSSSVRPIPVISARSETGSTMDRYGFAEGSASQRTVYGGRGDRISFHPPPSLGPPPSKHQRTFPSKSAVGKDKADRRRKGRAPGRNPFNLGDTSDEDELTMHIVPVPGHFARTPSRSPEPASTAATAASGRATPAVSALSVSPSNRPPTLRPPPESHPACVDVVDVSSDDEEKRQERRKAAKILYDARTHVSTVVDGLGKLRPPSLPDRSLLRVSLHHHDLLLSLVV